MGRPTSGVDRRAEATVSTRRRDRNARSKEQTTKAAHNSEYSPWIACAAKATGVPRPAWMGDPSLLPKRPPQRVS